jgi:EAL domain-containing protein (putative c-di-GMP-specific phosphodiesterase class I)
MQQWPEGVPTFKQGGHTPDHAAKITAFVQRLEAQVEAPFPSAPKKAARAAKAPKSPPKAPKLDEGATMPSEAIAALAERYGALPEAQREILREISAEANATGHSLNLILNPCERRYWITEALVRWSNYGWDGDVILAAIHKITEATGTIGEILATMSTQHAEQLAELATALTEERVTLAIGPDGITFTEQETT